MNLVDDVKKEISEMARIGIAVPKNYAAYCDAHATALNDYHNAGMKVSEIADLICQLA